MSWSLPHLTGRRRETMYTNCDHFHRETEPGSHWSYPSNTVIALIGRMTLGNPCIVASLLGFSKEGSHQGTAMDELVIGDLAKEQP